MFDSQGIPVTPQAVDRRISRPSPWQVDPPIPADWNYSHQCSSDGPASPLASTPCAHFLRASGTYVARMWHEAQCKHRSRGYIRSRLTAFIPHIHHASSEPRSNDVKVVIRRPRRITPKRATEV